MSKSEFVRDRLKRVETEIIRTIDDEDVIIMQREKKNHTCAWFKGRMGTKFEMEIYVID